MSSCWRRLKNCSIAKRKAARHEARYATIASAKKNIPESNLAVISVNGLFAAREARQALQNDLNVMLFSDNVPVEDELALEQLAHEKRAADDGARLRYGDY
ncbi:hypothetical protein ACLK11_01790 [Escherichia coli]